MHRQPQYKPLSAHLFFVDIYDITTAMHKKGAHCLYFFLPSEDYKINSVRVPAANAHDSKNIPLKAWQSWGMHAKQSSSPVAARMYNLLRKIACHSMHATINTLPEINIQNLERIVVGLYTLKCSMLFNVGLINAIIWKKIMHFRYIFRTLKIAGSRRSYKILWNHPYPYLNVLQFDIQHGKLMYCKTLCDHYKPYKIYKYICD